MSDLSDLRARLDRVDRDLIALLAARHDIIQEVAARKATGTSRLVDSTREREILDRLGGIAREHGLDAHFVASLFEKILDYSVRFQTDHLADRQNPHRASERIVVAYAGADLDPDHTAARQHFSAREAEVAYHGYPTPRYALDAVAHGHAHHAVLAVENTSAGSINEAYALLEASSLVVVGEEVARVQHALVALDAVPLGLIRRITAHPQAVTQCSVFLGGLRDCRIDTTLDATSAARRVQEDADLSHAALATADAAARYGLHVVEGQVANEQDNFTRYLVVASEGVQYDARVRCKTSLVFTTAHRQGALMQALNIFATHRLNLTKLESRPRAGAPWQYGFFVDFEGNATLPEVAAALDELGATVPYLRVLGSYPARAHPDARKP